MNQAVKMLSGIGVTKTIYNKKTRHFRIWLVVAGTGLEPVTFGL